MAIKNKLVIKDQKVANFIVVDTEKSIDPKEHGGDYFLEDQATRPGIGWTHAAVKRFEHPNGEERIEVNTKIFVTTQENSDD